MRHAITSPSSSEPDRNERKKSPRRIFDPFSDILCAASAIGQPRRPDKTKSSSHHHPGISVTDPGQTSAVSYHETNLPNIPSGVICPQPSTVQKAWLLNFHLSRQSVSALSLSHSERAGRRDWLFSPTRLGQVDHDGLHTCDVRANFGFQCCCMALIGRLVHGSRDCHGLLRSPRTWKGLRGRTSLDLSALASNISYEIGWPSSKCFIPSLALSCTVRTVR